jgi:hypothetical protein
MDSERLVELCDKARKEFYLRPSYIAKKAAQSVAMPGEFRRNMKSARTLLSHILGGESGR